MMYLLKKIKLKSVFFIFLFFNPYLLMAAGPGSGGRSGLYISIFAAILALIYSVYKISRLLKRSEGNEKMVEIANNIREGADAFLAQQYKWISVFVIFVFIVLFLVYSGKSFNWAYPLAFLSGGFISALTGFIGMKVATRANARTAWAAKENLNSGLQVAFASGTIMGLTVVGMGLLAISLWFILLSSITHNLKVTTEILFSFGMGASSVALFARLGGGIFTKAADVGADLVGKIEAGIPEDDPRNPATIADNVGDNVGDVAGMGADLFESYVGSIIATMSLGYLAFRNETAILAPLTIAGLGILASIVGTFIVRTKENASQESLLWALRKAIYGSSIIVMILSYIILDQLLHMKIGIFIAMVVGLVAGNIIGYFTEYYTSDSYKPTLEVAKATETGPATVIISGLAVGMRSTLIPVVVIVIGTILAYMAGQKLGGANQFSPYSGLFGIGMAAVGMLSTLGITLATDAYGPVADNAGGIAEMAGLDPEVRERTDALDSLGNTTAATGKGFAIGSAALTSLTLMAAFQAIVGRTNTSFTDPKILGGLFIGAMVAFLFSAMTMKAVGVAAMAMVQEVRRQFREIPGILDGTGKPDYQKCVRISTEGALKQMIAPSILALITPLVVGVFLGKGGMMAMLAGVLVSGFSLAIMMANAGGSWDNAKKYIERGNLGGKGSDAHKASVVGDTVGDPFKDTSGPSINILIKLMSIVSVVFGSAILDLGKYLGF